jgi:predicted phage tail protein
LSGFDNGWSPWSVSSQKEYTNLPAGTYKFRIRAINSYDLLSNEDSFEFIILPPWYKSNYAFLIYFAVLLFLIWGSGKYIRFRFKLQKRKLEIKKEKELWDLSKKHKEEQIQKENEILKLNNEKLQIDIARLEQKELLQKKEQQLKEEQDKIKQEQLLHEQEKHSLEISHKNKELSILAMQIAHKSELISKIRDYLTQITEKNASNDIKMLTSQLFQFIEKDIEHEKEWKEFQAQFEMVHSSFLHKLKTSYPSISPNLLKLSTYLRVKMSNKQIARLMNTTVETVIKSRYRLKERLNLAPEENLDDFIENF